MKKVEVIKIVVEQLIIQGDLDLIESAFSTEYVAHAEDKVHRGHKFLKRFAKQIRTAIPDIKLQKMEVLSETEDRITWKRTFTGTHQKAMRGLPASQKKIKWYEIAVTRFEGDLIAEEWVSSDLAAQMMFKL